MSSERDMRHRVIRALKPLHAIPVENLVGPGTPDVNFIGGWLELKSLDGWPARPETPVKIDCLTPQQRVWLWQRSQAGGHAFLLLKVGNDWLIYHPRVVIVRDFGREWEKSRMIDIALATWIGRLDAAEFLKTMRSLCSSKT